MLHMMQQMGPMLQGMLASGGNGAPGPFPADFAQFSPDIMAAAMATLRGNMEAAAATRPAVALEDGEAEADQDSGSYGPVRNRRRRKAVPRA